MSPDDPGVSAPIRILVVDDHPAVREGLSLLVSPQGMEICAEAGSRAEALAKLDARRPHLAIVDLSLDREDGLLLVADLKARGVPVLIYSMHRDLQHVESAFAAGALGYVTKSEFRGVLVEAIREVSAGRRFVSPKAAVALSERFTASQANDARCALSGKEREVYRLLGNGEGTFEIAAAMNISTHTVESYYARIQLKLGLEGMYELRRHAIEHYRRHSQ
jgi:DNA-binding NarL/FixJ family response regulator